jgi:hypothetical protein
MSKDVYYGEINCQKENCSNKAYFSCGGSFFCGVHSRKFSKKEKLAKRSKQDSLRIKNNIINEQKKEIEEAKLENKLQNRIGQVRVSKIRMMKSPDYVRGFLNVFPNFRHQLRTDGFGCAKLSPMGLGPVVFNGKTLSKNLENFHQGSKCFKTETNNGEPSELFFKNQTLFFNDSTPHRHKFKSKDKPEYFVWKDEENKIHKLNYIQSRQFYCNFYERLAIQTKEFNDLKSLIINGTNIQICGYDGRDIRSDQIEREYLNGYKPFGHELVLFHMLTAEPENYVWRKYKTFNF